MERRNPVEWEGSSIMQIFSWVEAKQENSYLVNAAFLLGSEINIFDNQSAGYRSQMSSFSLAWDSKPRHSLEVRNPLNASFPLSLVVTKISVGNKIMISGFGVSLSLQALPRLALS